MVETAYRVAVTKIGVLWRYQVYHSVGLIIDMTNATSEADARWRAKEAIIQYETGHGKSFESVTAFDVVTNGNGKITNG